MENMKEHDNNGRASSSYWVTRLSHVGSGHRKMQHANRCSTPAQHARAPDVPHRTTAEF